MTVVYFSPYSAIWKHTEIELAFLNHLKISKENAVFLSCGGMYSSFCNSMSAFGLTESSPVDSKKSVCKICKKTSDFKGEIGFKIYQIEDYVDDEKNKLVTEFINSVTRDDWTESIFLGVPIGRAALYEIQLRHKLNDLNLNDEIWNLYIQQLEYCAKTIIVAEEFLLENKPSKVVVYNDLYSLNYSFIAIAKTLNIPTYSLHANGPIDNMYSRYSIDNNEDQIRKSFTSPKWNNVKATPLRIREIYRIYKYLRGLLFAKSWLVYSNKTKLCLRRSDFRSKWDIPSNQKIVLVTLSSQDEIIAELFHSNVQKIHGLPGNITLTRSIIEYCKSHPDWFFIIRPHPREFSNRREKTVSASGMALMDFIDSQNLPQNVFVSRPEFEISLYHLIFISDYIINVVSSAGIEALAFGRPVLQIENSLFSAYPTEFNVPIDLKLSNLQDVKNFKSRRTMQQEAFRWLWFRYFSSTENKFTNISRNKFFVLNIARAIYVKKGKLLPYSKIVVGKKPTKSIFLKFKTKFIYKSRSEKVYKILFGQKVKIKLLKLHLGVKSEAICIRFFTFLLSHRIFFILD